MLQSAQSAQATAPGSLLQRLKASPWARPVFKVLVTTTMVAAMAGLGMRSAVSASAPESVPELPVAKSSSPAPVAQGVSSATPDAGTDTPADVRNSSDAGTSGAVLADGRVVLNKASAQELCRVRGIGPSRAEKIVALRTKLGRFRSFRDLLRVRGIGPRTLTRLKAQMVLDEPQPSS